MHLGYTHGRWTGSCGLNVMFAASCVENDTFVVEMIGIHCFDDMTFPGPWITTFAVV